ncbi:MAG: hypothetical protein AUI93_06340 [Crenarchaeota archaeon 13_1_40CM_3_52_10]|nr:MAG: hypothetical protein AUI93_06340 [Crenarchaeota archaeon 13_1_40CM_3_52_10]
MVDYGIVLGLLGVASGVASLIYSRSQVVAARRQAEEATRATLLESNREISVRLQQIRSRFFKVPGIDDELQKSRPEIKEVVDSVGGGDVYAFWRDVIDTFEDIFVLRRSGIVRDEHWRVWTGSQMGIYATLPRFQLVFKLAKQQGFLDPGFVRFFEPLLEGKSLQDPMTHAGHTNPASAPRLRRFRLN